MAFIVGGLIIGAGAALGGAALSAKGSKDAAGIAAAGSDREIEFNRESRDLVRGDQAPYRAAGTTALSALMDMTGLSGTGGAAPTQGPVQMRPTQAMGRYPRAQNSRGASSYGERPQPRYEGGAINAGMNYNVNEMGPENIYRDGSYTRGHGPATIDGSTGYVEPNTQGMAEGGFMGGAYDNRRTVPPSRRPPLGVVNPSQSIPGGTPQTSQDESGVLTGVSNYGQENTANSTAINPATGFPNENDGGREGGYSFQTDPGYQFRFQEGQKAIDRSASASGHSLSGGAVRKAIRYGQGMASDEYANVYNRISNIAGLGQTANQASGNAAMQAGAYMGNAASQGANASAYGAINAGNAWANAGNQIAQMPWGEGGGSQPKYDFQGRPIQYN